MKYSGSVFLIKVFLSTLNPELGIDLKHVYFSNRRLHKNSKYKGYRGKCVLCVRKDNNIISVLFLNLKFTFTCWLVVLLLVWAMTCTEASLAEGVLNLSYLTLSRY